MLLLILLINHHYQALCLALYWKLSLGCSYSSWFVIIEVNYRGALLFIGLTDQWDVSWEGIYNAFNRWESAVKKKNWEFIRGEEASSDIKAMSLKWGRCGERASVSLNVSVTLLLSRSLPPFYSVDFSTAGLLVITPVPPSPHYCYRSTSQTVSGH